MLASRKAIQPVSRESCVALCPREAAAPLPSPVTIPAYLSSTYWWAYVHPTAVRVFERQWLVNLILWGNFGRLRDAALDALGQSLPGKTLQIACVYGDLTQRMAARVDDNGRLDVVDVVPIQLDNLRRKLAAHSKVSLICSDSAQLNLASADYDRALVFFLLHEQPLEVRRNTIAEALRVVKPGGKLVIVDYHQPRRSHPLYWPMMAILHFLEPFALDLWRQPVTDWIPADAPPHSIKQHTRFGGLYQLLEITLHATPNAATPVHASHP